jgi:hypothetical protein
MRALARVTRTASGRTRWFYGALARMPWWTKASLAMEREGEMGREAPPVAQLQSGDGPFL